MRFPKHTALNRIAWLRDSTSPSWIRFTACLVNANLTPKLWPYAAHYAVVIYNNLPHSALDNDNSRNDAYGDSSDFSKLYVFGSICFALQPSRLLLSWSKNQQKDSCLELIHLAAKFITQSKIAYVARAVRVFDGKFLSTEEN